MPSMESSDKTPSESGIWTLEGRFHILCILFMEISKLFIVLETFFTGFEVCSAPMKNKQKYMLGLYQIERHTSPCDISMSFLMDDLVVALVQQSTPLRCRQPKHSLVFECFKLLFWLKMNWWHMCKKVCVSSQPLCVKGWQVCKILFV